MVSNMYNIIINNNKQELRQNHDYELRNFKHLSSLKLCKIHSIILKFQASFKLSQTLIFILIGPILELLLLSIKDTSTYYFT